MRTIIAGGRDFIPTKKHYRWLKGLVTTIPITTIISGGATGADYFGEQFAKENHIPCEVFPADWKKYGLAAGPKRNKNMADVAHVCVLFPGGNGTANMKKVAQENGLFVIEYPQE